MQRESIVRELKTLPGEHVVLVRYSPDFDPDREWVYNASNIDGSRIVWARDMGPERNRELLAYYPARQFWIVHADSSPLAPQLQPYHKSSASLK